jgi:hypothetical protein
MVFAQTALFDTLRELAGTSVTGTYQLIGSVFSVNPRILGFNNSTDVDIYVSTDGINNNLRVASNSFKLYDIEMNKSSTGDNLFPKGSGILIKTTGAVPTRGNFWVEALYSNNL